MDIITVEKSLTGRHYFCSDNRILWVGGKREPEAIAAFLRLDKFNPDQPRDARGRFSRVPGSGGGKVNPLNKEKVSVLQKRLQDAGIDPATLSHKARKSVLIAAIEAHSKGENLREAGLLKPTKPTKTRSVSRKKPVTPIDPKKAEPLRMTGDNAIAVHSKTEFKELYKQWEVGGAADKPVKEYLDRQVVAADTKDYFEKLKFDKKNYVRTPDWVVMPDEAIKANRKYHEKQGSFTEKDLGDGVKVYGNVFSEYGLATVLEGVKDGKISVGMSGSTDIKHFGTRKEAEKFASEHAKALTAARFIHQDMADTIRKTVDKSDQKALDDLKQKIKQAGVTDLSPQNLERISDNSWIRDSVYRTAMAKDSNVVAIKDKNGNLQAALSYTSFKDFYDPETKEKGSLSVDYLATSPWNAARINDPRAASGAGARAIADAVRVSQKKGFGGRLSLAALEGAEAFYEKIGFKKDEDGAFVLTSEKAKELVKKYG